MPETELFRCLFFEVTVHLPNVIAILIAVTSDGFMALKSVFNSLSSHEKHVKVHGHSAVLKENVQFTHVRGMLEETDSFRFTQPVTDRSASCSMDMTD